ncbi:transposase domain-containing protein [Pseudomonas indica]|uniref:transposase domain-containing protein n=1 Tax=Pseudomonas indica TaxID=137658 RepID=UPI003FD1C089
MRLSRALALTHEIASTAHALDGLGELLDPELVRSAFETAGVATLRKRRLPLEAMIWCVIGMALFRRMSAWDVVNQMDIMLPGQRPLVAPSAVVQGRQRLGSQDVIVSLPISAQARKQWPDLPETLQARLLSKTVKGKVRQILTSMTDPLRFPSEEIVDLYSQRWEIELGYREMKQSLLDSRYTLRSKTPEMIEQELWGVLLGYNLLRYQMLEMSRHCPGIYPCEMSFTACTWAILGLLNGLSLRHPGNIPKYLAELHASAMHYVLPHRREDRCYPRAVRPKPSKYPPRNKNASQLN